MNGNLNVVGNMNTDVSRFVGSLKLRNENNFGVDGREMAIVFSFGDSRDTKYDTTNGCASVWVGGNLDGEVIYAHLGVLGDENMFSPEERTALFRFAKANQSDIVNFGRR
jgi:hypothetical protein